MLDVLTRYDWPGNVRELRNEIDRAVALAREGDMIRPSQLSTAMQESVGIADPWLGSVPRPTLVKDR